MSQPRRIAFFTATRAEYGLLLPLMREVARRPGLQRQVLVSGTHLSDRHGRTVQAIVEDGVAVDALCDMQLVEDTSAGLAAATGRCLASVGEALAQLRPDLLVLLGDRYELLAAAQAALLAGVPVAHLCGGETTEGAFDDALRHAVSKLSHLHFVAAEPYRRRLLQMGEREDRVWTVGAPGLDNFAAFPAIDRATLSAELGFSLGDRVLLVTYHPATLGQLPPVEATDRLLAALDAFQDYQVLLTEPNADPGADGVRARLRAWAAAQPGRVLCVPSLGQRRYVAALRLCAAVVGNSSSGIVEAPAAGVATVNVGDRQKGRLRAASVVDVAEEIDAIVLGLQRALSDDFRAVARKAVSPYGRPGAAARMADILASLPLDGLLRKTFVDRAWQ